MKNNEDKTAAGHMRGKPQYVLIVEDDKDLRDYMARILELGGYRVTGAANGKVAIQFLLGAPIDLVVTDLKMPEMDGVELTQQMAEHFPHLPVIIMSGSKNATERLAGHELPNIKKLLRKPVSIDALISAVVEVLNHPQP